MLTQQFDLDTLLPRLTKVQARLVSKTAEYEQLVNRPLPTGSFYKRIAIRVLRSVA